VGRYLLIKKDGSKLEVPIEENCPFGELGAEHLYLMRNYQGKRKKIAKTPRKNFRVKVGLEWKIFPAAEEKDSKQLRRDVYELGVCLRGRGQSSLHLPQLTWKALTR